MNSIISGILGNTLRRYLVIALVVSLAVTGGLFAYAYTTSSTSFAVSGTDFDFGDITANTTDIPTYSTFGSYRGAIPAGYIFNVSKESGYMGDIGINVYLNNIDEIGYKYGMFMVRLNLVQYSDNASVDVEGFDKILSLRNGVVSFTSAANMTDGTTYHILCKGGVYRTFPWSYLTGAGGSWIPSFTAEVVQAGL